MRRALVLPLVLAVATACSSSTAPNQNELPGIWRATSASLPTGVEDLQIALTEGADHALTGTAVVEYIGDRPQVTLQLQGKAGLDGSTPCFPVEQLAQLCHVTFQFTATDPSDDTVFFQGQFLNGDLLTGDIQSSSSLPFWNVDGRLLQFSRVTSLATSVGATPP